MTSDAVDVAREIAATIGVRVDCIEVDGEFHASMAVGDRTVSAAGFSREEAFAELLRATAELGWWSDAG